MGAAKKMRPPCSLGRGKENTLIYDSADIELLRFAAAAKNIPPDLQYWQQHFLSFGRLLQP